MLLLRKTIIVVFNICNINYDKLNLIVAYLYT